ncbi:MAG: DUF362 domain-containing protein [Candidatus Omnitrophica bacterium]|nr:DUF362 domain-containing protein [Candidatus Omnitrophota bacterium]HOX54348.1 DUF362 domain-containing protein [Candidatus Omnitrophota bacterium]
MQQSKVFFVSVSDADSISQRNDKLSRLLAAAKLFSKIKKDKLVAIKLHFGEEENAGFVNPVFVKTIVNDIKKQSSRVFLTDTNALYKGSRTNTIDHLGLAYRHGFVPDKVGVPVVIADGVKSDEDQQVKINGDLIKSAYIATAISKADAIVALSHFKGHIMTGFGGAIKNLGMGCASRRGKLVQHGGIAPVVMAERCIACSACIENCPVEAIKYVDKKAKISPKICIGCASCIAICPVAAIEVEWARGADTIQHKITEYALATIKGKEDSQIYFNFAIKITKECDCLAKDDPKICPDIGIFASFDPVAIDQACVDKIIAVSGRDIFMEQHPGRDWNKQLQHAEKIGLGNRIYELEEVR